MVVNIFDLVYWKENGTTNQLVDNELVQDSCVPTGIWVAGFERIARGDTL